MTARREAGTFATLNELMSTDTAGFPELLQIEVRVQPEREMIKVAGRINFTLRTACSRCLAIFDRPISQRFTMRFSRQIPQDVHSDAEGENIELTAGQIGLYFYEGDSIDLDDMIQEQVVLALPFNPICREDCRGLCPRCGVDLNQESCQCAGLKPAGPFDVLKNLKLDQP